MTQPSLSRRKPTRPKYPTFDSLSPDTNEAVSIRQEQPQKQAQLVSSPTNELDAYSYSTLPETEYTHSIPITFSQHPTFSYSPISRRYTQIPPITNTIYSPSSNSSLPHLTRSISTSTIETASCCSTPGTITNSYEDGDCRMIANAEDCEGQIQDSRYEKQINTIINNSSVGRNNDYNSNDTTTTNTGNNTNDKTSNGSQRYGLSSYVSFPSLDCLVDDCWLDVKVEKKRESISFDLELEKYDEMIVGGVRFEY
ncbi:10420_t:CDS:1 [Paraglomus occultum]|uniref:10420_t:CDS:1 n=1 Tax=Paraglomus occultum TaxID=144539 RepID=A0A9N8VML1_9GLOM|nr:10420_t:CDS:1 [Paraglomus occultum]